MNIRIKSFFLLILIASGSIPAAAEQLPAPAPFQPFSLPLTDKTTATAVILPIDATTAYLVYTTSTGSLGFWTMTQSTTPLPPDPIPPDPTPLEKLTIAIVENPSATSAAQRQVLADLTWRKRAAEQHDFLGLIPSDLRDARTGEPPAHLLPFLERAKLHNLPWIIMCDDRGAIVWEGPLPATAAKLLNLIPNLENKTNGPPSDNPNRLAPPRTRSSRTSRNTPIQTLQRMPRTFETIRGLYHVEGVACGNADHSPRRMAGHDCSGQGKFPFGLSPGEPPAARSEINLALLGSRIGQGIRSSPLVGGTVALDVVARFDCLSNRRNQRSRWLPGRRLPAIKRWRRLPVVCVA